LTLINAARDRAREHSHVSEPKGIRTMALYLAHWANVGDFKHLRDKDVVDMSWPRGVVCRDDGAETIEQLKRHAVLTPGPWGYGNPPPQGGWRQVEGGGETGHEVWVYEGTNGEPLIALSIKSAHTLRDIAHFIEPRKAAWQSRAKKETTT